MHKGLAKHKSFFRGSILGKCARKIGQCELFERRLSQFVGNDYTSKNFPSKMLKCVTDKFIPNENLFCFSYISFCRIAHLISCGLSRNSEVSDIEIVGLGLEILKYGSIAAPILSEQPLRLLGQEHLRAASCGTFR